MTDLTPIINAFVALVAALISAFLIPWIRRQTTAKDREEMLKWVDIAVMAAQQLHYDISGQARKDYVLEFLAEKGYDVDSGEVDNAIEAAVLRLHQELGAAA